MKSSIFLAIVASLLLSFQVLAGQQDPGAHYQIQDLLPEQYHPLGVDGGNENSFAVPAYPQAPPHEYGFRDYERLAQSSRTPYEVVPGVVYYPSPYPRHYPGRRIHDPCFIHPWRTRVIAGEVLAQTGQTDPTPGQVGAASGAYVAGRIIGGRCR